MKPDYNGQTLGELSKDFEWVWLGTVAGWRPTDERVER